MLTSLDQFVIRPVRSDDLEGLLQVAASLLGSMTSLPKDDAFLKRKIVDSLRAFDPLLSSAGSDNYLFVLEDRQEGVLAGICGILARIGGFDPFYSYAIEYEAVRHERLDISHEIPVLHLERSHKGPSEVCSLLLRPDYRKRHLGRFLSLSRFVFMAAFGERFESLVIAEIRGVVDDHGRSPFWEAVGRSFFQQDFQTADFWSGLGNKQFIEDLMPKYPIYLPLLPKAAREAIGVPHARAKAAAAILKEEGFYTTNKVDIFDGGPILQAPRRGIRTINECRRGSIRSSKPASPVLDPQHIVARVDLDFRACLTTLEEHLDGDLTVSEDVLGHLEVAPGDSILYTPFHKKVLTE
ncbi:MAG: arginine N-succinyltransferase [Myxococcota bacterium]